MKLYIILYDKNCEPFASEQYIELDDNGDDIANDETIFHLLVEALKNNKDLNEIATGLGYGFFDRWEYEDFSIQHDARDGVIRLRDPGDCVGEPGNILLMIDLQLVE